MKKPAIQTIAVVLGVVVSFAALNALKKCDSNSRGRHSVTIGHVTEVVGQVERRKAGTVAMESVPSARPLYNQDLIVTQKAATATIQLEPDGPSFRLNENSRFIAELDTSKTGAFMGTLLDGTITVLNPGGKGTFRLFREGREISPESTDKRAVPVIPVDGSLAAAPGSSPGAMPATSAGAPSAGAPLITITATHSEETAAPTPLPVQDAKGFSDNGEPPTNEEIIRTLKSQTGLFQRCYLSFIHRAGQSATAGAAVGASPAAPATAASAGAPATAPAGSKGQTGVIVLTFAIQPSGKITGAKPVRSDFGDTTLHNCVTEVVERLRFKGFKGDAVPVAEFPIALQ